MFWGTTIQPTIGLSSRAEVTGEESWGGNHGMSGSRWSFKEGACWGKITRAFSNETGTVVRADPGDRPGVPSPRAVSWVRLDGGHPGRNEETQCLGQQSMCRVRSALLLQGPRAGVPSPVHACPVPGDSQGFASFLLLFLPPELLLTHCHKRTSCLTALQGSHATDPTLFLPVYLEIHPRPSFPAPSWSHPLVSLVSCFGPTIP